MVCSKNVKIKTAIPNIKNKSAYKLAFLLDYYIFLLKLINRTSIFAKNIPKIGNIAPFTIAAKTPNPNIIFLS